MRRKTIEETFSVLGFLAVLAFVWYLAVEGSEFGPNCPGMDPSYLGRCEEPQ
jgi:hypothetical protein